MNASTKFTLSPYQIDAARATVLPGQRFLEHAGYQLGVAMVDHAWNGKPAESVISALSTFQNQDGGFGRGLEVDIASPSSNPFAARLAMHVLLDLVNCPENAVESNLARWLIASQDEDGDWHLSSETRSETLAPWFAAWEHPSLNPACCVAGLAARLGIETPEMMQRTAALFGRKANIENARTGEFYEVLPYVEYLDVMDREIRPAYIDAIVGNIMATVKSGRYPEPGHFWEHVQGGGHELAAHIPMEILAHQADLLIAAQADDGGWPTPYGVAWRPHVTASNLVTLAKLRDGA